MPTCMTGVVYDYEVVEPIVLGDEGYNCKIQLMLRFCRPEIPGQE